MKAPSGPFRCPNCHCVALFELLAVRSPADAEVGALTGVAVGGPIGPSVGPEVGVLAGLAVGLGHLNTGWTLGGVHV